MHFEVKCLMTIILEISLTILILKIVSQVLILQVVYVTSLETNHIQVNVK